MKGASVKEISKKKTVFKQQKLDFSSKKPDHNKKSEGASETGTVQI